MKSFENMGVATPEDANAQLKKGFEIKGTPEEMGVAYEEVFEGVESEVFDALFAEFRTALEHAPAEAVEALKNGDPTALEEHATSVWGWAAKKAKQCALVGLFVMAAQPAFAEGYTIHSASPLRQEQINTLVDGGGVVVLSRAQEGGQPHVTDLDGMTAEDIDGGVSASPYRATKEPQNVTTTAVRDNLVMPAQIRMSPGVRLKPFSATQSNHEAAQPYPSTNPHVFINGGPGRVIYSDGNTVVFGDENSRYEKRSDGSQVSEGAVTIE